MRLLLHLSGLKVTSRPEKGTRKGQKRVLGTISAGQNLKPSYYKDKRLYHLWEIERMLQSIRKWISRTFGVFLLICTFGLIQINWSGCNESAALEPEADSAISLDHDTSNL